MIQQPGIYTDMPSADYFADPCPVPSLTQSIAKVLIERSPAHARLEHPRLAPPQEDEEPEKEKYVVAQAIGNAAHLLMIGRGKTLAIAEFDDWRKKDAQLFRADAEEIGKVAILEKHFAHAVEMEGAARRQLAALGWADAFTQGQGEVVIAWKEGETWFRSMIDWMPSTRILYDLKTSGASLAPHLIAPKMEADGWHVQAAMHERGLDVLDADNAGRRKFRFIAQENKPPYALLGIELDEHWLTLGRKKLEYAVGMWRACMASGEWPAYRPEPFCPPYPGYRETQWLGREIEHEERRQKPSQMVTEFA
jgi:hypothetical protein